MSEEVGRPEPDRAPRWSEFRGFLLGRVICIVSALLAIAVISLIGGTASDVRNVVGILIFDLGLTVPYYVLGRLHPEWRRTLTAVILTVEAILITVGEYFLGAGSAAYGLPLYAALVMLAAVVHSRRAALLIALLASASFFVLVLAFERSWIPERPGAFSVSFSDAWPWSGVLANTFTTLGLASIVGTLANETSGALARSNQLETELRELNRDLERRVEIAVHELREANEALATQNESLERTMNHVTLFARAVSHDLRNPITAAGEAIRLARVNDGGVSREQLLSLAAENLLRADGMLVGLRDLMRATGFRSVAASVDVPGIVGGVIAELNAASGGRQLPIRLVGVFSSVRGQPDLLCHIFRNLIGNAIEHNRGRPDLQVEVGQDGHAQDASFFVRDNGIGVPNEIQSRIFEPFHRGPSSSGDGLGLGLALVEAIVSNAGGKVWVESIPGQGATFRFRFPNAIGA